MSPDSIDNYTLLKKECTLTWSSPLRDPRPLTLFKVSPIASEGSQKIQDINFRNFWPALLAVMQVYYLFMLLLHTLLFAWFKTALKYKVKSMLISRVCLSQKITLL